MRYLAAALVTIALCAASFAGDAGLLDQADGHGWDIVAGVALFLFACLVFFHREDVR